MSEIINKIKGIYGEVDLSSSKEQGNFKYINNYQDGGKEHISRALPYGMDANDYFKVALVQTLSDIRDSMNNIGNTLISIGSKIDKLQNKPLVIENNKINKSEKEEIIKTEKSKSAVPKSGKIK